MNMLNSAISQISKYDFEQLLDEFDEIGVYCTDERNYYTGECKRKPWSYHYLKDGVEVAYWIEIPRIGHVLDKPRNWHPEFKNMANLLYQTVYFDLVRKRYASSDMYTLW